MRQFMTALALVAACSMVAVTTTGAQAKPAGKKTEAKTAAAKPATAMATHSTTGTVKSIDSNTLVISKGKKGGDMTFSVNGSTQKDGTVGVGSSVTVRYQNEGKTMVATAISEHAAKQVASSKPASTSKPATKK